MKKALVILFAVLTACTTSELPDRYSYVETYYDNGYSSYIEGRLTKKADYYRLLITNGDKKYLSCYAYDCSVFSFSDEITVWTRYNADFYKLNRVLASIYGYLEKNRLEWMPEKNELMSKGIVLKYEICNFSTTWINFNKKYIKPLTDKETKVLLNDTKNRVIVLKDA